MTVTITWTPPSGSTIAPDSAITGTFVFSGTLNAPPCIIEYPNGFAESLWAALPPSGGPVFSPDYATSSVSVGTNEANATVRRVPGYPSPPTFRMVAIEGDGTVTLFTGSWQLQSQQTTATAPAAAPVSAPYGTDGRTFLDLGSGPDLDPLLLINADPRIVMAEALARRLTTIRGQLFYAPNDGWDLRQLVNAALSSGDLQSLQGTIQQECLKDPRVQIATVQLTTSGSIVSIVINASGAAGPFEIVFTLATVNGSVVVTGLTFQ